MYHFHHNTMKTIIKLIAVATALLPLGQLQAKTFGGFAPKKTFTLKVTNKFVSQSKTIEGSESIVVPVPEGIVKLSVGQPVKFTIGAKGQLVFKGFEVPFESEGSDSILTCYDNQPKKPTPQSMRDFSQCAIAKDFMGQPLFVELKFYQTRGKGLNKTVTGVIYRLEKK